MENTKDDIFEKKRTSNKFLKIMIFLTAVFSIINVWGIYSFYKMLLKI